MTTAEKILRAKQDYDDVYEQGKTDEYNKFWDAHQDSGKRVSYENGFVRWADECLYPKYDIKPTGSCASVFFMCTVKGNLKQRFKDCGIVFDTSNVTSVNSMFQACYNLTVAPEVDVLSVTSSLHNLYYNCSKLKEASIKNIKSNLVFTNTFRSCGELKIFDVEGEIGNSIDFKSSPLDKASITNIIEHLCTDTDVTGQTLTLKESAVNAAFGIDASDATTWTEEWINLIRDKSNSYNGNWNISFA